MGISGKGIAFRAVITISYGEITTKWVTPISFLCLISLKTVLLQSVTTYIGRKG